MAIKIIVGDNKGRSDVNLVKMEGFLDNTSVVEAEKIMSPFIIEKKHLIIDCANLTFVNSTGLAFLFKCYIQMKKRGSNFIMVSPNESVSELLTITGTLNFFNVYKNVEEAIKNLEQGFKKIQSR